MGRRGGGRDFEGRGGEDRRGEGRRGGGRGGGRRERWEDRLGRLDDRLDRMEERIERLEQRLESPPIPCPDPQRVLTVGPMTGDSSTLFTTTTSSFRVNYDFSEFLWAPTGTPTVEIRIRDASTTSGQDVAARTIDADADTSFVVNAPPGTYNLVVDDEDVVTYTVSVDQCRETTTTTTTTTTAPADEPPGSAIS